MSLRKYLADPDVTAEIARNMALAYDQVRIALRALPIELPLDVIARRIAEEAREGFDDPAELTERALSKLLSAREGRAAALADNKARDAAWTINSQKREEQLRTIVSTLGASCQMRKAD